MGTNKPMGWCQSYRKATAVTLGEDGAREELTWDPAARSAAAMSQSAVLPSWGTAGAQGADWADKGREELWEITPICPSMHWGPFTLSIYVPW